MRCPKCKLNSFDYNTKCPKCNRDLTDIQQILGLIPLIPQEVDFVNLAMNYYLSPEDDDNQDFTDDNILDGNNNLITDAEMLGSISNVASIEPLVEIEAIEAESPGGSAIRQAVIPSATTIITREPLEAIKAELSRDSAIRQAAIPSATTIVSREPIEAIEAEMVDIEPLEAMLTNPPLMTAEMTTSQPIVPPQIADSLDFNELDAQGQAGLSAVPVIPTKPNYATNSSIEATVIPQPDLNSFNLDPLDLDELDAPLPQQADLAAPVASVEPTYATSSPAEEAKPDANSLADSPLELSDLDAPAGLKEELFKLEDVLQSAKVEPIETPEDEDNFFINPLNKIPDFPVGAIASSVNVDINIADKVFESTAPKKASQATLNEEDFLTVELDASDIIFEDGALNPDDDLDFSSLDDPESTVPIGQADVSKDVDNSIDFQAKAASQVKPAVETFMVDELPLAPNLKEELFSTTENFSNQSDDLDVDLDSEFLNMPSDFDLGAISDFSDSAYEQIKSIELAIGKDEGGLPLDTKNSTLLNQGILSDDSENVGKAKSLVQEKIKETGFDFEKKQKLDIFEGGDVSQTKLDEKELDELFGSSLKKE